MHARKQNQREPKRLAQHHTAAELDPQPSSSQLLHQRLFYHLVVAP